MPCASEAQQPQNLIRLPLPQNSCFAALPIPITLHHAFQVSAMSFDDAVTFYSHTSLAAFPFPTTENRVLYGLSSIVQLSSIGDVMAYQYRAESCVVVRRVSTVSGGRSFAFCQAWRRMAVSRSPFVARENDFLSPITMVLIRSSEGYAATRSNQHKRRRCPDTT